MIAAAFGLRNEFHSHHTLGTFLIVGNPPDDAFEAKNVNFSIPSECGFKYLGESCKPMQVRVNEHRVYAQRGKHFTF